jgi:hypothetical protein
VKLRTQVTLLCVSLLCVGLAPSRATTASNLPRVRVPLDRHLGDCRPFFDGDGDGVSECEDCNDNDDAVHPGHPEICDGKDNDCDAVVDEGCAVAVKAHTWSAMKQLFR